MKRARQYLAAFIAIVTYYLVHEGSHLFYALWHGALKQINLMPLGVQVDIYRDRLSDIQFAHFCMSGAIATIFAAWVLTIHSTVLTKWFGIKLGNFSPFLLTCSLYTTIAMLLCDPLYLSVLQFFMGDGDMYGIQMMLPRYIVIVGFALLFISAAEWSYSFGKSVRLCHLLFCILFDIPSRQYIRFLRLHDGIGLTGEFPGNLNDGFLGGHALAAVAVVAS